MAVQLPKLTEGYLGPQAKFEEYGMTTLSHPEPVIYMTDDQEEVGRHFRLPDPLFPPRKPLAFYVLHRSSFQMLLGSPLEGARLNTVEASIETIASALGNN